MIESITQGGSYMIIDIHVHHSWHSPARQRPNATVGRYQEHALRNDIRKIVLLTLAYDCPPAQTRERNSATLQLQHADPDFFVAALGLNPLHDEDFIRSETKRCVQEGARAIKLHMSLNARDHRHDLICQLAAEHGIPIIMHSWYKMANKYPNESDGSDLAYMARRNPQTKIVAAHLTGLQRRGVLDLADIPNAYIDTSGCLPENDLVEYAVRYMGSERMLFGSDYPGRCYEMQVGRVLDAEITEEQKQDILWRNAASMLGLGETI